MKDRSTFLLSASLYLFLITFCGYVALIYIEDIYIFRQLEKNNEILPLIYVGRVLIAFSFSIIIGTSGFLYIYRFMGKLRKIEQNILALPRIDSESNLPEPVFSYTELHSLNKRIFDTYREEKERGSQLFFSNQGSIHNELKQKLLPQLFDIKLKQIKNLDISIIPSKSRNNSSDYLSILETKNGCIICITGTAIDSLDSIIFKFKVKCLFESYKKISIEFDESLFYEIYSEILEKIEIQVNFTLLFISKDTGRVLYHKYQRNPLLYFQNQKIFKLEGSAETDLSPGTLQSSPRGLEILENELLLILSDRIEKIQEFSDYKFLDYIISNYKWKEGSSTKELLLETISMLENWQNLTVKTDSIYEYLVCVVIRKK